MFSVFQGWRRKLGCVLLVVACGLMICWARSSHRFDMLQIGYGTVHIIYSTRGEVHWITWDGGMSTTVFLSRELPADDLSTLVELIRGDLRTSNIPFQESAFLYWPIVIPLTLLTACLILWKPRHVKLSDTKDQATNDSLKNATPD